MDDETARRMDRLLADGKVSGPESDALLERIFETLAREEREEREQRDKRRPLRAIPYVAGAALAAAAAIMLVIGLPRAPGDDVPLPEEGVLSTLEVRCSPGTLSACPSSSTLLFSFSGQSKPGFLSAYAEPIGPDAEPVFYFSKQDGSPALSPSAKGERATSERALRFPPTQRPGRYRIHAVLADRPLTRAELIQATRAREASATLRATLKVELLVTK